VFVVVAAALAVLVILFGFSHEQHERREGALASLVPRVRVAAPVRRPFLRATPSLFAPWAQMGLTLSLLVSLAATQFGISNRFESGLIVVVVCLAGTASGFALRDVSPARTNNLGALGLIAGTAVTLWGLHADAVALFVLGSAIGGLGLGASMSGSIRTLSALPAPSERGEFFAAVYTVGYLAFSVPAVLAGFAAVHFGLLHTTYVYGAGVVGLALAVLAFSEPRPAPVSTPSAAGLASCRD
jgi:hypothetical protein